MSFRPLCLVRLLAGAASAALAGEAPSFADDVPESLLEDAAHAPAVLAPTPAGPVGPWSWQPLPGDSAGDVTLLFAGDMNLQDRAQPADAFQHTLATLRAADFRFCNLEMALVPPSTDPRRPDIEHKPRWRHSHPSQVHGLVAAGFDAVGFGSNVSYPADQTVMPTIAVLRAAGIPHVGSGANLEEAHRPLILERRGVRIGIIHLNSLVWPENHRARADRPGVATLRATTGYQPHRRIHEMPGGPARVITAPLPSDLERLVAVVRELRERVDVLALSMQWGISSSPEVADYQKIAARAAIDAGADFVFGHGPHVLQAVELHRGRPIFYSLGNFAFDWERQRKNVDGLLLRVVVRERRPVRFSLVPLKRDAHHNPVLLDPAGDLGAEMARSLILLSGGAGVAPLEVAGREIVIRPPAQP
jgi:hypothetical protein